MAERRLLSFCVTCGVTPRRRISATKSVVSIGLVRTDRGAMTAIEVPDHRLRRLAFDGAGGGRGAGGPHQAAAGLHHHVAHVAQPRRLALRLLVETRVRIGGRSVGLVAALLAVEVALAVATG